MTTDLEVRTAAQLLHTKTQNFLQLANEPAPRFGPMQLELIEAQLLLDLLKRKLSNGVLPQTWPSR